jgi:hypothetical protein
VEEISRVTLRLARAQHGVVSRFQITGSGVSESAVDRRIRNGTLVPVFPGVYAVGHDILSHRGWWRAALLSGGPGSVLSHATAAACWGLISPPNRIDIIRGFNREPPTSINGPRRTPNRSMLRIHRTTVMETWETVEHEAFPLTSVPRTLLNLAARSSVSRLETLLAEADRLRLVDWREMRAVTERGNGWPGAGKLREIVQRWNPDAVATKSELERRFLGFCSAHGYPSPSVNVVVGGFEVDCLWPKERLIVELDSALFHQNQKVFESDRRRDSILSKLGYEVRRVTDEQLRDGQDFIREYVLAKLTH